MILSITVLATMPFFPVIVRGALWRIFISGVVAAYGFSQSFAEHATARVKPLQNQVRQFQDLSRAFSRNLGFRRDVFVKMGDQLLNAGHRSGSISLFVQLHNFLEYASCFGAGSRR